MEYQKASQIRKKSLLTLIGEKKFEQGKGLGSSIGGAISDKFKAKATGIKESLDPLNWLSSMVGQGGFGRMVTTAGGRIMGKSDEDIKYFGGYAGKKKKKGKKDPQITSVGAGAVKPLQVGDSIADILGKMYNFMEKTHEIYKLNYEIETAFRQEQMDEDERRHKKLIESITGKKVKPEEKDGVESFIEKLLDGIKKAISFILKPILAILGGIGTVIADVVEMALSGVVGILTTFITASMTAVSFMLGKRVNNLVEKLLINKTISAAGDLAGGLSKIGKTASAGKGGSGFNPFALFADAAVAALAINEANKEYYKTLYGDDFMDKLAQSASLGTSPEDNKKREELKSGAELDAIKYQRETLIPAMKNQGYEVSDEEQAGHLEFKDFSKDGKSPGLRDVIGIGLGVQTHAFLKKSGDTLMENIKDQGSKLYEKYPNLKKENIKSKLDENVKPYIDKLNTYSTKQLAKPNIPTQLSEDEILQKSLGKNDQIISQNSTNVIGQKSPAVINVNGVRMRDSSTQDCVRKSTVPC